MNYKQELKQLLIKSLNDKDIVNVAFLNMIKETQETINNNEKLDFIIDLNKQDKEEYLSKIDNKFSNELVDVLYNTNKNALIEQLKGMTERYETQRKSFLKAIDSKNYYKYINDLFNNEILKYTFFIDYDVNVLSYLYDLVKPKNITPREYKQALDYIQTLVEKVSYKVYSENLKYVNNVQRLKDKKNAVKYEQQQLELINVTYTNRANVRVNKITNDLSVVSNDNFYSSQDYKMVQELKTLNFNVENESLEESQETINKLNKTDIFTLNAIIDIYKEYGIGKTFTNTQIANLYFNETGQEITREQKEIIHKSIEKLTSTKIKIGLTSETKGKIRKLSTYDYLVKLTPIKYEAQTTTYYYSIDTKPLYYQYLTLTHNNNVIEGKTYNRQLLTDNIKGTKKTEELQQVRYWLIEQFSLDTNEFTIDLKKHLYALLGLNKENKNYKKQTYRAREQLKNILERYKEEKEYNFTYEPIKDNRGNLISYKVKKQ